ncbi:DUF790 family protein [Microvenator marinus]|uniref:DUF790 family protein n=1 Tax=Microvenator marinus TaxID=2600177 RepID=A0A5B8XJ79_9DELT|nr:DUF790 family protein [Microvenator marinus]QED25822.1 DUF790 family protein [Microvenator marinus]
MLTADLLVARIRKDRLYPGWFKPDGEAFERVEELVELFRDNVNGTRSDLDEGLETLVGAGTDFLIWRGLAKLLFDRTSFEIAGDVSPVEVRQRVHESAARVWPLDEAAREQILSEVGDEFDLSAAQVLTTLHADLPERQRVSAFEDISPEELVDAYNLALAQAVLYKASHLQVRFVEDDPKRVEGFFRALRFHGLMHQIHKENGAWVVDIDGPATVVSGARKYGLAMAVFLPTVIALGQDKSGALWSLSAQVEWKRNKMVLFELDSASGLKSERRIRGVWVSDEEKMFESRFDQKVENWSLTKEARVFTFSDSSVMTTDYVLKRADGAKVWVEIVGHWRQSYLESRLKLLDELKEPIVLVVAERLRVDKEKGQPEHVQMVFYKGVIRVEEVVKAAESALA